MPKATRSNDWGFPRWRGYGSGREAQQVRICDRHGCTSAGECPAPKAPNSPERWYFCQDHAAEYNRGWDYFQGLDKQQRAQRAADEQRNNRGYTESAFHGWAESGDGSRSRDEMRALDVLGLSSDSDFEAAKKSWRSIAKANHPDVNPGNMDAAERFRLAQAAFDVLKSAEERRSWRPD
jgi:hypothetical protein